MGTRAGIYCRISRDAAGTALGVDRQKADCKAFAERSDWEVVRCYVDNDLSAFSGKGRPGYSQMCADVADGLVDVVVAWDPDRLHRSPTELETFIDLIEQSGVRVATVNAGEVDLSSAAGRMTARVVGAVARHESEHKSERLRRKHLELAQNGKLSGGGRRPFGYESDRLTVRPDEAALIRDAAARVLAGDSVRSVVTDWKAAGVQTVTGATWSSTTVKRLLASGRISGRREHHGDIVGDATWPPIITPAESDRLRVILHDPNRRRVAGVAARSYLLAGFVTCGRCSTDDAPLRMTSRPTARGRHRYVCISDRGGCDRCGIGADHLEALVTEAAMAVLDTPQLADAVAATVSPADDDVAGEIETVSERLAELARDYYDDRLIGKDEYLAARDALDTRRRDAEARLAASTLPTVLAGIDQGALRSSWPDMSLDRRRAVLAQVIDRVEIAPTTRANNRFDPDRVSIAWRA